MVVKGVFMHVYMYVYALIQHRRFMPMVQPSPHLHNVISDSYVLFAY